MIPAPLQNPELCFYLVRRNDKRPAERSWTTSHRRFFDAELLDHIKGGGNYGIRTGVPTSQGYFIILDFDDWEYYLSVRESLPDTFTVLSASKRLPHLYYFCDEAINTTRIDVNGVRVCDLQADRAGIVCAGSKINRKRYEPQGLKKVAQIKRKWLSALFPSPITEPRPRMPMPTLTTEMNQSHQFLATLGIKRTTATHYECPFHPMHGSGNLTVMPNGKLYCFHEQRCWHTLDQFKEEYDAKHMPVMRIRI